MNGLFRSNKRMIIFSKTKNKSYHSKHVNGLKLQPIQISEAVVSSLTSSQVHFNCIVDTPHSTDDLTKAPVTFSWHLLFYVNEHCGLLNIASCGLLNIASLLASNKTLWARKCNRCSSQNFFCQDLQASLLLLSVTWTPLDPFVPNAPFLDPPENIRKP